MKPPDVVSSEAFGFDSVERAVEALKDGRLVVVVDDETRENEGDLVGLAERATPEMINFMITYGRGLVCAPLAPEVAERLDLSPMIERRGAPPDPSGVDPYGTAFTVSVDLKGVTTGISAHERAATVQALAREGARPDDFLRPGHVFPLLARRGGVLVRRGHTEAAIDLARLAGARPVGVICEILNDDGAPARRAELFRFAARHGLPIISIADLADCMRRRFPLVERAGEAALPTAYGPFRMIVYRDRLDGSEHAALVTGDVGGAPPFVRLHSECLTGDVFQSRRCDCGEQLDQAIRRIAAAGRGAVLYLRQEGRGIGLANKIRAYALQDAGLDTVEANHQLGFPADARDYAVAAEMLRDLGLRKIVLLTNNPDKVARLKHHGIDVAGREPLLVPENEHNRRYLETKRTRLGHLLDAPPDAGAAPSAGECRARASRAGAGRTKAPSSKAIRENGK
ncbi:MAG: bifunctional 3,4-dihydroxy-2-butanone-4-phosphate synthase/GTP cyclohydrolase II [Hydrogenibacillus sp.]|nr:bifunctional 3,4-dihydroxy-2-butanone-4-phosphate synthase/GTP cyclohydrolase II [Hydrogenibacillus sp.]